MGLLRQFRFLLLLVFLAGLPGCSGNPATAPAPLIEIPMFLQFPTKIEIDLGAIGTAPDSALSALIDPDFDYSNLISQGPELAQDFGELDFSLLTDLAIPVDPDIKFSKETNQKGEVFKIDFRDFDLNGDGAFEGCSGSTCPVASAKDDCPERAPIDEIVPVCYRIWIDEDGSGSFKPLVAGLFNQLPIRNDPNTNEENPGAGRFFAEVIEESFSDPPAEELISVMTTRAVVIYDHRNPLSPADKSNEIFLVIKLVYPRDGSPDRIMPLHIAVDQTGLGNPSGDETADKLFTVKLNTIFADIQYTSRFREEIDFWSGSVIVGYGESPLLPSPLDRVFGLCVQLSTGKEVEQENCINAGIDVTGIDFIRPTTEEDVSKPNDFPETPTF